MPKSICILWDGDDDEETYEFETSAEITAFRRGIEAAGATGFEIVYTDEEL